jgi:hypothetical protein
MNDNYLWDRSGEPETDVQELEEILGTLRHRPRSLEIPVGIHPRRRSFVPAFAIAAAILLLVLTAGVWRVMHRTRGPAEVRNNEKPRPQSSPAMNPSGASAPGTNQELAGTGDQIPVPPLRHQISNERLAANRRRVIERAALAREREAAIRAKEDLLAALKLTSAKLSEAQRRIQPAPAVNNSRNQHKLG